jgi:hypothetical protein
MNETKGQKTKEKSEARDTMSKNGKQKLVQKVIQDDQFLLKNKE